VAEGKGARSAPSGTTKPSPKKPKPEEAPKAASAASAVRPAAAAKAATKPAAKAAAKPTAKPAPAAKPAAKAAPAAKPAAKPAPAAKPTPAAQAVSVAPARRKYKRHEISLADGGTLVLEVDGSILRLDAAGVATTTWQPDDPDWARHALRFGVRPQNATVPPHGRDPWRP
jgi:hypothetical protein